MHSVTRTRDARPLNEQNNAYTLHLTVGTHSARHIRRIDVALGVTELLSNVVRHVPGSRAVVRLRHDPAVGRVRVEVTDEGPPFPLRLPGPADPCEESGRGLALVAAVTEKWGVQLLPVGRTVWFETASG